MGEMINEILKKLKPKEKIAIIVSMSALAVILLSLVILLAFCGADRHKHVYDCILEKVDGQFNLVGMCTVKDCEDPELVVRGVNPATEVTKEATCGIPGEIVYTYTHKGNTGKYVEKTEITGKHTLNGKPIEELLNEDGSINSDVSGVRLAVDGNYPCGSIVKGFFECESCERPALVDVYIVHKGLVIGTDFADCETEGAEQEICTNCGAELGEPTPTAPLGHAYTFELQQEGGKSNLVGTCQRAGCTNPDYLVEDITDLKEISKTQSTCAAPGVTVYQYVDKDGKKVEVSIISSEKPNHILCGVDATTLADADGHYDYKQEGVKMFAGKVAECGKLTGAYYICEECTQLVRVEVTKPGHTMKLDYSTVTNPTAINKGKISYRCYNEDCTASLTITLPVITLGTNAVIITDATATSDAIVKYTHTVSDFGVEVELEIPFSTDHDHVYKYTLEEKSGQTNLVGFCTVSGCPTPEYREDNITDLQLMKEIPATCLYGKTSEYTCLTSSGKKVTFQISDDKPTGDHILNDVVAKGTQVVQVEDRGEIVTVLAFEYGQEGINVFSSQSLEPNTTVKGYFRCEYCGETVLIWVYVPADYQP